MRFNSANGAQRFALMRPRARLTDAVSNRLGVETDRPAQQWYSIRRNAVTPETSTPSASIDIYGEIGFWGVESAQFASELRDLDAEQIDLHINSPGGDIYEGIAIYNALVEHPAKINVRIDGLAASIASVIAQAGDHVAMMPQAQMMIHDAWGLTVGNAAEHLKAVEELNRHSDNIASVYASRSGRGTVKSWRKAMEAETWYTADEAKDAGLVDAVVKHSKRGNSIIDPVAQWSKELTGYGYRYNGRAAAPAPDLLPPPASGGVVTVGDVASVGERGTETVRLPNGVSFGNSTSANGAEVTWTATTTTTVEIEVDEESPVALDPGLIFAALLRAEGEGVAAVAAETVAAGISAAAATIGASAPPRDATQTSFAPPAPEPYAPETLPPISTAERILAATQAAAAEIAAEGDRIGTPGSSYTPPAPEPYAPPVAPPINSAEWVLASTAAAAATVEAEGSPVPVSASSYAPPAPEPYAPPAAPPISSAEWVLAATRAHADAPGAAVPEAPSADPLSETNDYIRKGFLEVLLP